MEFGPGEETRVGTKGARIHQSWVRELGGLLIMFKMEKHIQRQDSNLQFNRNVQGCFWSMFHTVDYHAWHNVKKMLPYRKHSRSKGSPKSTVNHHVAEVPEQIKDENKTLLCTTESCPFGKSSGEAHEKEVITKKKSEEESQKDLKLNFNSKRRLSRTKSIHHLEPSGFSLGDNGEIGDSRVASQQRTPMELAASGKRSNSLNAMDAVDYFSHRKIAIRSTSFREKSNGVKETLETKQIIRNVSSRSFKEDLDIQEIYKANRKLFAELLHGVDANQSLQIPKNPKSSASLAKSRSFPAPGLARKGYRKLSSLEHKQNESFPKGKKYVAGPQPSKLVESESPTNFHNSAGTSSHNVRQQTSSSYLGLGRGLKHGGWNQLVIKRFNFIKHKIKHPFKERKKVNNQKTVKLIPTGHELLPAREESQDSLGITTRKDSTDIRGYGETNSYENDNTGGGVQAKMRIASLNASLERYSQLANSGFNRNTEAKCHNSESLRLTSEDKIPNREKSKKSFGRNLSMPDIDLFCTLFTDPPHGVSRTEKPKAGLVHSNMGNIRTNPNPANLLVNADRSEALDSDSQSMVQRSDDIENMPVDQTGCLNVVHNNEVTAWDELEEKIPHLDILDSKHHQILGSESRFDDVSELSDVSQLLEIETCFQDDDFLKLSDLEGFELNTEFGIASELDPFSDQPNMVSTEALPDFEATVEQEIIDEAGKISNYLYLRSELDSIENADFNYMRYILQLSSFIESGHVRSLSSSMFDGEEAHFYKKLEYYWKKVDKDSDHQLLLDLVYETLHNVFERSFICFLKTFSWKSRIRPMPLGQYLLEEVREKVAWYLCLGPELDQSLDDVVGRDLSKGDDWMNLQSDTEFIALELEDLIIDELLDEVIYF